MTKKQKSQINKFLVGVIAIVVAFLYTNFIEEPIGKFLNSTEEETLETFNTRKVSLEDNLSVYFVDVGQADCIMISNKGKYMLIDAGNNEDGPKLVTYFKDMGIEKFDYVVGTHAHEDHIGGLDDIIKNFEVDTFYMPDVITTTRTFEEVVEALEEKSVAFETPKIDSTFNFSDAYINVIYVGDNESDLNNTSIVLKLTYGDSTFLFTGDASTKVEKQIKDKNIQADVLKAGHHGSNTSSSATFLEKVNPKYIVIQVGENNTYNHPGEYTLKRFEKIGAKIYRNDLEGTIIATTDGKKITFTQQETDTNG